MEVLFATSNRNKFAEAAAVLKERGVTVKHFPFEHNEMRSDSLEEIAREAVGAAYEATGRAEGTGRRPVFVEDSGLFIDALNGFPGPYSAWAQKKLGNAGILRLMTGVAGRTATFEACIAYHDGKSVRTFPGKCPGSVAMEARGSSGFGYDPIFVPQGRSQTFAENIELKNNLSHRYKSLLEFSKIFNPS
jgi:XTP/dITP diphosphohydrolase